MPIWWNCLNKHKGVLSFCRIRQMYFYTYLFNKNHKTRNPQNLQLKYWIKIWLKPFHLLLIINTIIAIFLMSLFCQLNLFIVNLTWFTIISFLPQPIYKALLKKNILLHANITVSEGQKGDLKYKFYKTGMYRLTTAVVIEA